MSTSVPLGHESDLSSLLLLADKLDESKVTPGVLGFLVFAVMGLAVWALMRSMTRRMDAVQGKRFDEPAAASPAAAATRSAGSGSDAGSGSGAGSAASEGDGARQGDDGRSGPSGS
ncbi:hypothetical protein JGS22_003145 [Streptomyces sp. P38-E01]|uniref:Uncharacterized protein n=1 Tax=Streptomyces tardus TaxID=2780544 RepID=A0A949N755_9ACTN|nr:hypothetical protein [Streptomyces tardus]MBU7596658.1 hypothetical protein [Streptomyces tardus]